MIGRRLMGGRPPAGGNNIIIAGDDGILYGDNIMKMKHTNVSGIRFHSAVAVAPDGLIVTVGSNDFGGGGMAYGYDPANLTPVYLNDNPDGGLTDVPTNSPIVNDVSIAPDGKIVIAGNGVILYGYDPENLSKLTLSGNWRQVAISPTGGIAAVTKNRCLGFGLSVKTMDYVRFSRTNLTTIAALSDGKFAYAETTPPLRPEASTMTRLRFGEIVEGPYMLDQTTLHTFPDAATVNRLRILTLNGKDYGLIAGDGFYMTADFTALEAEVYSVSGEWLDGAYHAPSGQLLLVGSLGIAYSSSGAEWGGLTPTRSSLNAIVTY